MLNLWPPEKINNFSLHRCVDKPRWLSKLGRVTACLFHYSPSSTNGLFKLMDTSPKQTIECGSQGCKPHKGFTLKVWMPWFLIRRDFAIVRSDDESNHWIFKPFSLASRVPEMNVTCRIFSAVFKKPKMRQLATQRKNTWYKFSKFFIFILL